MALFGPKSKEYGDLNRKSITEIDQQVEETKEEVKVIQSDPFSGSDPGLVPASDETTQAKYLRGDGQWGTPAGGGGGTEDYEDLANKPAIDGTELSKNSTAEGLGLAKTSDLPDMSKYAKKSEIPDVPTKTSDLDNDSGFITNSDIPPIPSKTSDLDNDSGYLTSENDPTVPSWAKQQNPPTPATFDGEHAGLVPAPASGDSGKYLKADGTWGTPASSLPYVEVTGSIFPGHPSCTLSDAAITATSTIDVYTDADVDYVSVTPGTGSVTVTFDEPDDLINVKVRVS